MRTISWLYDIFIHYSFGFIKEENYSIDNFASWPFRIFPFLPPVDQLILL